MPKRWSLLVCLSLMTALLMAGCGSSASPSTTPAPSTTPPAPTPSTKPTANLDDSLGILLDKAKTVDGLYFEYVVETTGAQTGSMKMWWTKKAQKIEMSDNGQAVTMIMDSEAKVAYMVQPEQKIAMKMPLDQSTAEVEPPLDFISKVDTNDYKVVETVTLNGTKCKVIVPKDGTIESGLKLWISEEHGVPIRVESVSEGSKWAIEYRNLKVGPIAPETFKVPTGYQIMDLSKLP